MPQIIDATVVNQAYDTSGNGGRKLVRLNNGNQYVAVKDTTTSTGGSNRYLIYKSTNNWQTVGVLFKSISINVTDINLSTDGYRIYVLLSDGQNDMRVYTYNDDGTSLPTSTIDSNQSAIGNNSLTINPQGTELHATWASKNSSYPNSFNIRYAKGTINTDGSVTWGAVEQWTTYNTTGNNVQNPSVVVYKDGAPVVFAQLAENGGNNILSIGKGSSTYMYIAKPFANVYAGGLYAQSSPSAIFVPQSVNGLPNGRIWVAWSTTDASNYRDKIAISYSDDGGVTWSNREKFQETSVDTGQQYPSITANKNNEIFVVWTGQPVINITEVRMMKWSNNSWSTIETITNINVNAHRFPSTLFDQTFSLNFSEPLFIYRDTAKVGFYGTWTTTDISVPQGELDSVSDKNNLLSYNITTDGSMETVTEKINGVVVGTKTLASGENTTVTLTQEQWDAVRFGKFKGVPTLLPKFSEWVMASQSTITSEYEFTLNATGINQSSYIEINVSPNTTYTLSVEKSSNGQINTLTYDSFNNVITNHGATVDSIRTFTTESNAKYIRVLFSNFSTGVGAYTFKNPMLVIGDMVKSFISPYDTRNTLTIEMGTEVWTYPFEKALANDADILSAVKAVKDANEVYFPAIKSQLASAIRGKGGSVNDNDSFEILASAISGVRLGTKSAIGTATVGGDGWLIVTELDFKTSIAYAYVDNNNQMYAQFLGLGISPYALVREGGAYGSSNNAYSASDNVQMYMPNSAGKTAKFYLYE